MKITDNMGTYKIFLSDKKSGRTVWGLNVDNIELLAGMLAAGVGIIDDLNNSSIESNDLYIDSDADVSSFRVAVNVMEDNIRSMTLNRLIQGQYGIWMKGDKRFYYSMYAFRTNYFFQGIVSICSAFQVDFRNYLYGFPFDSNGKQYALDDYIMAPYQIAQDAFDLDDIEEQEAADENIIEPLARTDDIIII